MDNEKKTKMDNPEKQRLVASINLIISMLEKANLAGSFTLKESSEVVQALAVITQFVNGPLQMW